MPWDGADRGSVASSEQNERPNHEAGPGAGVGERSEEISIRELDHLRKGDGGQSQADDHH